MMTNFSLSFALIIALAGLMVAQPLTGVLTAPVWAGQAEQFTPEFHELHKNFDPKHTPKIVAPDRVNGSMSRFRWAPIVIIHP
jgi:hypothetical protein